MNNQRILSASDGDSYRSGAKRVLQGLLILATGGGIAMGASALAQSSGPSVEKALVERLPKTEITAIDCEKIEGVCEVQARQNLFYIDHGARYLIIGRVYDMETKQDLTAARLLEMNPDMLIGGGGGHFLVRCVASPWAGRRRYRFDRRPSRSPRTRCTATERCGRHGPRGKTITVFSDFRCGYCKRLHETLETLNVKVVERPISVLGTRPISEAVICSPDKRRAVNQAYDGRSITTGSDCDTSGLDANEAFARQHGFSGTPVIVREDGAVVHGYRPRQFLENWIQGSAS